MADLTSKPVPPWTRHEWAIADDGTLYARLHCWKELLFKEDCAAILRALLEADGDLPPTRYAWLWPIVEVEHQDDDTVIYRVAIRAMHPETRRPSDSPTVALVREANHPAAQGVASLSATTSPKRPPGLGR